MQRSLTRVVLNEFQSIKIELQFVRTFYKLMIRNQKAFERCLTIYNCHYPW